MLKRISLSIVLLLALFSFPLVAQQRIQLEDERKIARNIRGQAAVKQTIHRPLVNKFPFQNNEESSVPDYAACFTKILEHDPETGLLTAGGREQYKNLLIALHTGLQADYNRIQLSSTATRKFVNPQNGFAFSLEGCDSSLFNVLIPPQLSSRWAMCDMIEVYLKALCRDVRFQDYGTGQGSDSNGSGGSLTSTAATVLNAFGPDYRGPRNSQGQVDASVVFRGTDNGPLIGPYVSQFLLLPLHMLYQPLLEYKQYLPIASQREFGVSWQDFIAIQNGAVPKNYNEFDFEHNAVRYPITGRDLATYVHFDGAYEPYFYAINILMYYKFPFAANLPYNNGSMKNEGAFNTMGASDLAGIIAKAAYEAFKVAWCEKWRNSRRLRPEAMAGLIHRAKITGQNPYNLDSSIFNPISGYDVLDMVLKHNEKQATLAYNNMPLNEAQTYLLGLVYPEGSPIHPSYTSGHATVAGACTTVIKALVNDQALIRDFIAPVKPDPNNPTQLVALSGEGEDKMTVGSELDKLASNIALARDFAGIHYRSDGDYGILLGEEVGIRLLEDHAREYTEQGFDGFELTKRNGQRIRITATGESLF